VRKRDREALDANTVALVALTDTLRQMLEPPRVKAHHHTVAGNVIPITRAPSYVDTSPFQPFDTDPA